MQGSSQNNNLAVAGLLSTAQNWPLLVDLGKQLKFPAHIAATSLQLDIVILSEASKLLVLIELMVPWEGHIEEAFERKLVKYQGHLEVCQRQDLRAYCYPTEVGCRGFIGHSLYRAYILLGMSGPLRNTAIRASTEAAERASR